MIVGELGPRPLCPRCKENTRASKATYCRPCGAEYMREQRLGKHSKERICENCSTSFTTTATGGYRWWAKTILSRSLLSKCGAGKTQS